MRPRRATPPARSHPGAARGRRAVRSSGGGEAATFASRVVPDLPDEALMALDAELDHDIDEEVEQLLDVRARQLLPAAALLDQQHELLEGELRARRMHARDRARVPGVHVPEVIERLLRPQLRQQDPVGSHAQARLEQMLRRDASETLIVLAVEEADVVRVAVEDELARVLD